MGQTHKIDLTDSKREPVVFEIGDDTFTFNPPKMFTFMDAVIQSRESGAGDEQMFGVVMDLLYKSLPVEQGDRLKQRLADDDDALDVEHLVEIFQTLTKAVTDRPTLSTLGD